MAKFASERATAKTEEPSRQERLEGIADHTLTFFEKTAQSVLAKLDVPLSSGATALASVNTFTAIKAVQTIDGITAGERSELLKLLDEPAIARIVLRDEDGKESTFFIARAGSLPGLASYRSPIGRMAALPVGAEQDIKTSTGVHNYEVIERAHLYPALKNNGWDSDNTRLQGPDYGPVTIVSLRDLLQATSVSEGALDILEMQLAEGRVAENVLEGLRRSVIAKMGLRDQPLLDQYQDEIFRLPLGSRLVILGPPGTGKTTTLIKRLGQKVDWEYLEADERAIVSRTVTGQKGLSTSWLMFTPTELLKLYVKEAFAREGIAAPDARIQTWEDYRHELARNKFGIFRTGAGTGAFSFKKDLNALQSQTLEHQTQWFGDFNNWQIEAFWSELSQHAKALADNSDPSIARIGSNLTRTVSGASGNAADTFVEIGRAGEDIQELLARLKAGTDGTIRAAFARELRKDADLLNRLVYFIGTLAEAPEDSDDADSDEEEDVRPQRIGRDAAFEAYTRAMRALARARAGSRTLSAQTRNGKIIEWLGDKSLPEDELRTVGQSLLIQASTRRFANPLRRLMTGLSSRYRRFRRQRQTEGRWYKKNGIPPNDLSPLEADIIILAMLRHASELLANSRIATEVADGRHPVLQTVQEHYRTQIIVDEATDFSPVQLACMGGLCDPHARSFLACGDFNQRITSWGSRSMADLKWVFADLESRPINITYRHSRQLNDLARQIALISAPDGATAELPEHVNNDGVSPVLAYGMSERRATCDWLAERIGEIERLTGSLPSIAVLVNHEDHVEPMALALDAAPATKSIRAVACLRGRVVGQENDIRVFDVQHIKGLEFEGVFFVGVDRLAQQMPDLFDKYLYVGTTRAAYYLGFTTEGPALPPKIAQLANLFQERWP